MIPSQVSATGVGHRAPAGDDGVPRLPTPPDPAHQPGARSEEVQELLSQPPAWLVRAGIGIILGLVSLLLGLAWCIKYPDLLTARVMLTSPQPPASIVAHRTGRLERLLVAEKEPVRAGQVLAVIENPAAYEDVLLAGRALQAPPGGPPPPLPPRTLTLGMLQGDFSQWVKSSHDYRLFRRANYHGRQLAAIGHQIRSHAQLQQTLRQQTRVLGRDVQLTQRRFNTDARLREDSVIAALDLDLSESALLQKQNAYLQANSQRINADLQLHELRKAVIDLRARQQEQDNQLQMKLQGDLARLKNQLHTWEQQYLLKSPIAGRVTFYKFRSRYQNVKTGDEVMTVVPAGSRLFCQATLPVAGAGKVKAGQRVMLKFDYYPFEEHGTVRGVVESVSLVPRDNSYVATIRLPGGLKTTYGQTLVFRPEMAGRAEIITEELRLLERCFYQLRKLLDGKL